MEFKDLDLSKVGQEVLLIGGAWAGMGGTYICLFPEYSEHEGVVHVIRMTTDDWQKLIRQSDLVETEVLAKAEDGSLYKTITRKCQRNVDQNVAWKVYRRDRFCCRYCGNDQVPLTVDHIILWEEGGPSTEENLVAACRKCNKTRGNEQYGDWLKHPYYLKVSQGIPHTVRAANIALAMTLDEIPRVIKKRKR